MFLERYKEGYDGGDERYKIWLKMYHPDAESILSNTSLTMHTPEQLVRTKKDTEISHVIAVSKPARKIDKIFSKPIPPYKLPTKSEKNSGRVLTSSEALKALQEKKRKVPLRSKRSFVIRKKKIRNYSKEIMTSKKMLKKT